MATVHHSVEESAESPEINIHFDGFKSLLQPVGWQVLPVAVLTVAAHARRIHYRCEVRGAVFALDDVVFAWAIDKAALVVIVCVGPLVYAAWAVTYQRKNAMDVGIPRDSALRRKGSVKADKVVFIANRTAEEADGILARTSAGRSTTTSATHLVRLHRR